MDATHFFAKKKSYGHDGGAGHHTTLLGVAHLVKFDGVIWSAHLGRKQIKIDKIRARNKLFLHENIRLMS